MKLRRKLNLTFTITIFTTLLIVGLMSYRTTQKIFSQEIETMTMSLSSEISESITKEFEMYRHSLGVMRTNESFQQAYYEKTPTMLMREFENYITEFTAVSNIYIGYKDKSFYIYPQEAQIPKGFDPRERPWYQEAIEKEEAVWTDPYTNNEDGLMTVSIAMPIRGKKNEIIGVLAADIDCRQFLEKMNTTQILETGYPYILDRQGNVITHKDESIIGEKLSVPEIQEAISEKRTGRIQYTYKGVERIAVYDRCEETGWTVVIGVDEGEIKDKSLPILMQILSIGFVAFILSVIGSIVVSGKITQPFNKLQDVMNHVKVGDLSQRVENKSKDEIGDMARSFNIMLDNVSQLVSETKQAGYSVGTASDVLSDGAKGVLVSAEEVVKTVHEIALGAGDQAKDAENGVIKASELNMELDQLLECIQYMMEQTDNIKEESGKSADVIRTLRERSSESGEAIARIGSAVNSLADKSHTIGTIVNTIYSIADQTNLLALNASIEAARAGEHGRGFAVVAEEIRKLAEESAKAVKEIQHHIQEIQNQSDETTQVMDIVRESGELQTVSVKEVEDTFRVVIEVIEVIVQGIEEATEKVGVISEKKEEVVGSIENISAVSQETAAASQEVTTSIEAQAESVRSMNASAGELRQLASKLEALLKRFNI